MVDENQQQDGADKLPPDATGVRQPEVEAREDGDSPSKSTGVRRLNRKVVIGLAGLVAAGFLGFVAIQMFGGDSGEEKAAETKNATQGRTGSDGADEVNRLENESRRGEGKKPSDKEAELASEEAKKMKEAEARQAALEKALEKKQKESSEESEEGEEEPDPWEEARKNARRQRAQRFHKQALAATPSAVFAKMEVGANRDESKKESGQSVELQRPESAEQRLARARRQVEGSGAMAHSGGAGRSQDSKQAFLETAGGEPTQNVHRLQDPVSDYVVQAGTVLPLVLETGMSSDLPGYLKARVSRAVYDTPTGQHLLIPAGAVVLGRYNSQVDFGDKRVQVVWTRMILPDGSSMQLGGIPGVDLSGKTGVTDRVDYHWDRLIGGAVLSTGLAAGAGVAAGPRGGDQPDTPGQSALTAAGENVSEIGDGMVKRELGVDPTLEIRPGMQMAAVVHQDMVLRPYQEALDVRGRGE